MMGKIQHQLTIPIIQADDVLSTKSVLRYRQSTSVNFVIEDATLYNEGLYTCIAKNLAGQSQVDTYVEIKGNNTRYAGYLMSLIRENDECRLSPFVDH